MAVTDFLFEGQAPTPVALSGQSSIQFPAWYNQYNQQMLQRAIGAANLPYAQYTGPRIAGFTPTEQAGFEMTKGAAGAYQPFLTQASTALSGAMKTFPQAATAYMSPYTEGVVNRIGDIGVRQLQEKFLPAVGEEFIKAGQFGPGRGSSRMGEFGARALRDVQESVLGQQAKALEAGYKTSADIFGQDVAAQRQAATAGADIAGLAQKYGLSAAQAVTGVGSTERAMQQANLEQAYKDFMAQRDYPMEQAKFLASIAPAIGKVPTVTSEVRETLPAGATGTQPEGAQITGYITTLLGLLQKYKELYPS